VFPQTGDGERLSGFHLNSYRLFSPIDLPPFVKAIGRNQTAAVLESGAERGFLGCGL